MKERAELPAPSRGGLPTKTIDRTLGVSAQHGAERDRLRHAAVAPAQADGLGANDSRTRPCGLELVPTMPATGSAKWVG